MRPNIGQADHGIPDDWASDEQFQRIGINTQRAVERGRLNGHMLAENMAEVNDEQIQVADEIDTVEDDDSLDELSKSLSFLAVDTNPNAPERKPNNNDLSVELKPHIKSSLLEQKRNYQISTHILLSDRVKEKFKYNIADCIRHGSKDNWIRLYRGIVTEEGFGNKVSSLIGNTGRFFLANQKTYFWKPKKITGDTALAQLTALTEEAVRWTVDNCIGFNLYLVDQVDVPLDADLELKRANLPSLILDGNRRPCGLIIVNEAGTPQRLLLPTNNPGKKLDDFIGKYYGTPEKTGFLEVDDWTTPILKWLLKVGHTPAKLFPQTELLPQIGP